MLHAWVSASEEGSTGGQFARDGFLIWPFGHLAFCFSTTNCPCRYLLRVPRRDAGGEAKGLEVACRPPSPRLPALAAARLKHGPICPKFIPHRSKTDPFTARKVIHPPISRGEHRPPEPPVAPRRSRRAQRSGNFASLATPDLSFLKTLSPSIQERPKTALPSTQETLPTPRPTKASRRHHTAKTTTHFKPPISPKSTPSTSLESFSTSTFETRQKT